MGIPTLSRMRVGAAPRVAAETVDGNDVRTAARDAARDGGDVVHRCDFDDDRHGVVGCLLQGAEYIYSRTFR